MASSFDHLVPQSFAVPQERAPVEILRELGATLYQNTKYKVRGVVETVPDDDSFIHLFRLHVPKLDYTYDAFQAKHNAVRLYPVTLTGQLVSADANSESIFESEEQFMRRLGEIFHSKEFQRIVGALLAQAR